MFSLNSKSSLPIYEQLQKQIIEMIAFGILHPADQLPAVRALARDLGVNPNTVQKVYQECERLGYIYSIPGKGSFVSEDNRSMEAIIKIKRDTLQTSILECLRLGMTENQLVDLIHKTVKENT